MENMDIHGMLTQSGHAMGVGVMNSIINHSMAGMGFFARVKLGKRILIR